MLTKQWYQRRYGGVHYHIMCQDQCQSSSNKPHQFLVTGPDPGDPQPCQTKF
uniref:Uncharacterized protein n=1 Tax=Anguilla anguilla TaxID=7936 RepID=A0A0E9VT07_ANGAN